MERLFTSYYSKEQYDRAKFFFINNSLFRLSNLVLVKGGKKYYIEYFLRTRLYSTIEAFFNRVLKLLCVFSFPQWAAAATLTAPVTACPATRLPLPPRRLPASPSATTTTPGASWHSRGPWHSLRNGSSSGSSPLSTVSCPGHSSTRASPAAT